MPAKMKRLWGMPDVLTASIKTGTTGAKSAWSLDTEKGEPRPIGRRRSVMLPRASVLGAGTNLIPYQKMGDIKPV
jgi:hypothetical protein